MIIWWMGYHTMTPNLGSGIFWRGGSGSSPTPPGGPGKDIFFIGHSHGFGGHHSVCKIG